MSARKGQDVETGSFKDPWEALRMWRRILPRSKKCGLLPCPSIPTSRTKREGHPPSILHESFRAAITLKGIDGGLEAIGGVLLWFIKPSSLNTMSLFLFEHELPLDSHDFIAIHFLNVSQHLANGGKTFASIYLLSHGLTKAALVIALWFDRLWAYPLTIAVFSAFSVYQIYRFTHTHSLALALLTVFDLLIIYLTWEQYGEQKSNRPRSA